MRLCEIKILREDSTPASDATNSFAQHWGSGWKGGEAKAGKPSANIKIDPAMLPIIEAIVSDYPVHTTTLDHAKLKSLLPDDEAREKATKCMDDFPALITTMANNYMTEIKQFKDRGLNDRIREARGGKDFAAWNMELTTALPAQLNKASTAFTTDPESVRRIVTAFRDQQQRKMIIAAVMDSAGTDQLVSRGVSQIKKAVSQPLASKDPAKTKEATDTVNTAEAFVGFCRALLENHFAIKQQIQSFLKPSAP